MESQPQWTRHVGKVSATARFFCVDMTAEQVTEALGVEPTDAQTAQERPGGVKGARDTTLWSYDSSSRITSSDLNDHVKHLLDVFLPLRSRIEELRPLPHIIVCTYWESTIAGIAGPQLDAQCMSGLAALGASLEIRVVKIEEVEDA
jgi:hypothetical protein